MRRMKKLLSLMLALVMVLAVSVPVTVEASEFVITIENSVTDKTYSAYKVFDATYSGTNVSYTITTSDAWYDLVSGTTKVYGSTGDEIASPFTLTSTTTSGTYTVSLASGKKQSDVAAWFNAITTAQLTAAGITTVAATGTGNGGSIGLDVGSAGYYYITTTTGSTVTVTTADPAATVQDKNQEPGNLDKTVDDATASIGDTVTYTITSSVPAYDGETEIEEYKFVDTLDAGLIAPSVGDVTVKILDSTGAVWAYLSGDPYIDVTGQVITISYDPRAITKVTSAQGSDTLSSLTSYPADAKIEITYTAKLDADAVYANNNTVTQTWTGESTGVTDTETVYTYGFNLVKENESGTQLEGAEFTLTKKDDTTPIGFIKSSDGMTYTVSTDTSDANYVTVITSVSSGNIEIFGLDKGDYTLTETKAPSGYNLAAATTITVGADGSYSKSTGLNNTITTVVDKAGTELPETGGMGTTILYIIGGILVIGAAVLLVTRRRMSRAK